MSTSAKDLRETLTAHCKHERTRTYAETSYWLSQYKGLARRAIQHAEALTSKLQAEAEAEAGAEAGAEAAEVELAKLREQEPIGVAVACNKDSSPGFTVAVFSEADVPAGSSVYASPIPAHAAPAAPAAPAVPEEWLKCWLIERPASSEWPAIWLTITTDGRRWVSDGGTMYATGGDWYFTSSASEALKFADKESADEYVRHNKIKDVVATEHIFDDRALLQSSEVHHD